MPLLTSLVPVIAVALTLLGAWFVRRDETSRSGGIDSTKAQDLERRVVLLEATTVSRVMFDGLKEDMTEMRQDLREIRKLLMRAA
jgi:membrane protein implicated in regulation of membrane protease activity